MGGRITRTKIAREENMKIALLCLAIGTVVSSSALAQTQIVNQAAVRIGWVRNIIFDQKKGKEENLAQCVKPC